MLGRVLLHVLHYSNSPEVSGNIEANLRSVTEIPSPYQNVFSQFRYFNVLQSNVLDQVFYTGKLLRNNESERDA